MLTPQQKYAVLLRDNPPEIKGLACGHAPCVNVRGWFCDTCPLYIKNGHDIVGFIKKYIPQDPGDTRNNVMELLNQIDELIRQVKEELS
jgi:hypothetical protein